MHKTLISFNKSKLVLSFFVTILMLVSFIVFSHDHAAAQSLYTRTFEGNLQHLTSHVKYFLNNSIYDNYEVSSLEINHLGQDSDGNEQYLAIVIIKKLEEGWISTKGVISSEGDYTQIMWPINGFATNHEGYEMTHHKVIHLGQDSDGNEQYFTYAIFQLIFSPPSE